MTITSFTYLLFLAAGVFIYYLLPRKWQWVELLGLSILFYCIVATPYTLIYILIATAAVYFATAFLEKGGRKAATTGVIAVVINAVLWFALKGYALWAPLFQVMGITVKAPVAALGMGYYTLQAVGYILDCYWGNSKPLKNPLQLLLFLCFFPQMITGPISRFHELEDMYEGQGLSYQNLTYGAQRILWGFFKKLVLAERVGVLVTAIWGNLWQYNGFYSWIAFLAFPLQLYADFSGCIDIALGTAQLFGIRLPGEFQFSVFFKNHTGILAEMAYHSGNLDQGLYSLSGVKMQCHAEAFPLFAEKVGEEKRKTGSHGSGNVLRMDVHRTLARRDEICGWREPVVLDPADAGRDLCKKM